METKHLIQTLAIAAVGAGAILALTDTARTPSAGGDAAAATFVAPVEEEGDHIKPADLADKMMSDASAVITVDVRPDYEFAEYHLPGAVNLTVPQLLGEEGAALLDAHADKLVVLYSNGMVHPAQAWVELSRRGYANVRVLEGGLTELKQEILTPPSLRGPISEARARAELPRFQRARAFFLGDDGAGAKVAESMTPDSPAR